MFFFFLYFINGIGRLSRNVVMTGNILFNGNKKRLDYGAIVSRDSFLSVKLIFLILISLSYIYSSIFDNLYNCLSLFFYEQILLGLCNTRGCIAWNNECKRNHNIFSSFEASNYNEQRKGK